MQHRYLTSSQCHKVLCLDCQFDNVCGLVLCSGDTTLELSLFLRLRNANLLFLWRALSFKLVDEAIRPNIRFLFAQKYQIDVQDITETPFSIRTSMYFNIFPHIRNRPCKTRLGGQYKSIFFKTELQCGFKPGQLEETEHASSERLSHKNQSGFRGKMIDREEPYQF